MKLSIKNAIYQAVIGNKWLDISYVNKKKESTNYYIGVNGIDIESGKLYCDIFNPFKNTEVLSSKGYKTYIYIDSIVSAEILEQSYYETPAEVLNKFTNDKNIGEFLEVVNFDNNILKYLSDCYRLDNDPFLKDWAWTSGM